MESNRNDEKKPLIDKDERDLVDIANASFIKDGDELRNINSYEYLKVIAEHIPDDLPNDPFIFTFLKKFKKEFVRPKDHYRKNFAYGDLYTQFILTMEDHIEDYLKTLNSTDDKINQDKTRVKVIEENLENISANQKLTEQARKQKINELENAKIKIQKNIDGNTNRLFLLKSIIRLIYNNPNSALERTGNLVESVIQQTNQTSSDIESVVTKRLANKGKPINKISPQDEGSKVGRLKSMVPRTYKPQSTTSMASERSYAYKGTKDLPTEYRFGTQGQYHRWKPRVSPLFKAWVKLSKHEVGHPIGHVYFNNLGLDRSGSFSGFFEKRLTNTLHGLEKENSNIAVITLPADMGLMDQKIYQKHKGAMTKAQALDRMLSICVGASNDEVKDFLISKKIKKILYGKDHPKYKNETKFYSEQTNDWNLKRNEERVITRLLNESFNDMGFTDKNKVLTQAQIQAVYFHFIKYKFTNFILETLKPTSFNMTCKDAIDRGGVSSAYYNLLKSIELEEPLKEHEFHRALHAAPTMVKGRGMNHHTRMIWNAVNSLIEGKQKSIPQWLSDWHKDNAPPHTKQYYINQLNAYISEKAKLRMQSSSSRFFKPKYSHEDKYQVANKLLAALESPDKMAIQIFKDKDIGALNQGKLGEIYEAMKKDHLAPKLPSDSSEIKLTNNKFI